MQSNEQVPVTVLTGFLGAGKTTLFNKLTGSNEFQADKMFATLDTVTRKNLTPGSESIIYILSMIHL